MRFPELPSTAADALRGAGVYFADLMTPTLRIGVTGLARAGKTVFITALVRNLVAGGRLPFFGPNAEGRILRAFLEPQPDAEVPRFDFERHIAALSATPPTWRAPASPPTWWPSSPPRRGGASSSCAVRACASAARPRCP